MKHKQTQNRLKCGTEGLRGSCLPMTKNPESLAYLDFIHADMGTSKNSETEFICLLPFIVHTHVDNRISAVFIFPAACQCILKPPFPLVLTEEAN